jgi:YjbE family integral membrane protein
MLSLHLGSLAGLIPDLVALAQVLFIDLVLAGDNAVVVGMAVAGLPPQQKRRAMVVGIVAATVIRIGLATIALQLLAIVGLMLAGGILLLWVCWRMYREIQPKPQAGRKPAVAKSVGSAMVQIVLADLSMSLDNVLAVAGAADGNIWVLSIGLAVSILLMALAASLIARLLERRRWIAWIGLLIVLFVALKLIWEGGHEVVQAWPGSWLKGELARFWPVN